MSNVGCCPSLSCCGLRNSPCVSGCFSVCSKTAKFIKKNWDSIIVCLVVWAAMIAFVSHNYGFARVGKPLGIGLGVGIGLGILTGIVVVGLYDEPNREQANRVKSGWTHIKTKLDNLDKVTAGLFWTFSYILVSQMVLSVPYAVGGLIGMGMGNHLATGIGITSELDPVPDPLPRIPSHHRGFSLDSADDPRLNGGELAIASGTFTLRDGSTIVFLDGRFYPTQLRA